MGMGQMTREEFLDDYFTNSSLNRKVILTNHVVLLCNCGKRTCHGWALVSDHVVESFSRRWLKKEEQDDNN